MKANHANLTVTNKLIRRWLASECGTSYILVFVFSFNAILGGQILKDPNFDRKFGIPGLEQDLIKAVVGSLVLVGFNKLWTKQKNRINIGLQNFAAWVSASILIQVISYTAVFITNGKFPSSEILRLLPIGVAGTLGNFVLFTVIITAYQEHKTTSYSVFQARKKLVWIQTRITEELKKRSRDLQNMLDTVISPALAGISDDLSKSAVALGAEKNIVVNRIKDVINSVVRPASHELGSQKISDFENSLLADQYVDSRSLSQIPLLERFLQKVNLGSGFIPTLVALQLFTFYVPSIFVTGTLRDAFDYGVLATCMTLFVLIISRALTQVVEVPFFVAFIVSVPINFLAAAPFLLLANRSTLSTSVTSGEFIGVLFSTILTTYFGLLVNRWDGLTIEAARVNNEIALLISRVRNEISLINRKTAQFLHGNIQARLQAAALRIARAETIDDDLRQVVASEIQLAQIALDSTRDQVVISLGESIDDLIDFWVGVCSISTNLSRVVDTDISLDIVATECVIEICREAISNAVKHDQAHSAEINFELYPDTIELVVSHPGSLDAQIKSETASRSLGKSIFDELSLNWELYEQGGFIYMRAFVARI